MTNFEKYRKEILEIVNVDEPFGVCGKEIKECSPEICPKCIFYNTNCVMEKFKWLYEEAASIPAIFLTKAERAFCEILECGHIARDEDGGLYLYQGKPVKKEDDWVFNGFFKSISHDCFQFITWDDEKPWSIENLLKLEVDE